MDPLIYRSVYVCSILQSRVGPSEKCCACTYGHDHTTKLLGTQWLGSVYQDFMAEFRSISIATS